jgi:hypothetical protein
MAHSHERKAVRAGLFVDEVVDVALAIDGDLLAPVPRYRRVAHQFEQRVQFFRLGVRVFDELETVSTHRVVGADCRGRRVMRKWTHGKYSLESSIWGIVDLASANSPS